MEKTVRVSASGDYIKIEIVENGKVLKTEFVPIAPLLTQENPTHAEITI